MKKALLLLLVLTLLPINFVVAQEVGDTDYWEVRLDTVDMYYTYSLRQRPITKEYWQRIADRWTIEVDTVIIKDSKLQRGVWFTFDLDGNFGIDTSPKWTCYMDTTIDTTYTAKLPVFLDSAQYDRLMELLEPIIMYDNWFPDTLISDTTYADSLDHYNGRWGKGGYLLKTPIKPNTCVDWDYEFGEAHKRWFQEIYTKPDTIDDSTIRFYGKSIRFTVPKIDGWYDGNVEDYCKHRQGCFIWGRCMQCGNKPDTCEHEWSPWARTSIPPQFKCFKCKKWYRLHPNGKIEEVK